MTGQRSGSSAAFYQLTINNSKSGFPDDSKILAGVPGVCYNPDKPN